jgi:hypothetical protein
MPQNEQDPMNEEAERFWADIDLDEQEYLERLASFGEGYFDFAAFMGLEEGGETGFTKA